MADNNIRFENRKAKFEYEFIEEYEAGIMLVGTEIKSIRQGHASINEAYAYIDGGEVFIKGMRVDPLQDAADNHDPLRVRKLLLNKTEIKRIAGKLIKGTTVVVKSMYLNQRGICKLGIAVAKGKKLHDKRETIKNREADREMNRLNKHNQ
jgi:SsrA-binding protein